MAVLADTLECMLPGGDCARPRANSCVYTKGIVILLVGWPGEQAV
jgi:hypothetical protein